MRIVLVFLVFLSVSCTHKKFRVGDRRLSLKEVPEFLIRQGQGLKDPEYFEKWKEDGSHFYEVKNEQISISLTTAGQFIEKEEDIKLDVIDSFIRKKMMDYLDQEYHGAKLIEVEKRVTPTHKFIDLEIRHDSSPSGYWEISFSEQGVFVSREIEDYEPVMTLN